MTALMLYFLIALIPTVIAVLIALFIFRHFVAIVGICFLLLGFGLLGGQHEVIGLVIIALTLIAGVNRYRRNSRVAEAQR